MTVNADQLASMFAEVAEQDPDNVFAGLYLFRLSSATDPEAEAEAIQTEIQLFLDAMSTIAEHLSAAVHEIARNSWPSQFPQISVDTTDTPDLAAVIARVAG